VARIGFGIQMATVFPYHYGSHATGPVSTETLCAGFSFPYHYGSHATGNQEKKEPGKEFGVSIPLWFSRNMLMEENS